MRLFRDGASAVLVAPGTAVTLTMSRNPLTIDTHALDGALVLTPQGYLDISTRLKLSTALNDAVTDGSEKVVVDLCGTSFMDSTGLGVLVNALRRLTRQQRELHVVCPPGGVRRVFELSGLDSTFRLHDSIEQAL